MPGDTLDASETVVLRHDASGIEYKLPYGDCIIGRVGVDGNGKPVSPDLVVTDNKKVGKHHAKITYDGLHYYIIDLVSKNKTWVNGQLLESGNDHASFPINGDGDYTYSVSYTDRAGNVGNTVSSYKFTIDKKAPEATITFDVGDDTKDDAYYNSVRTATFAVDDNIIARNALLCLLAVRMNFGVSIEFCVRQIVMGNLILSRSRIAPNALMSA